MGLLKRIFSKKDELLPPVRLDSLSTDLHSHLIPGIDDGSPTLESSIELLKKFIDLGYKKVITTPHIMSDYYRNTPEIINIGLESLRKAILKNELEIQIEAAAEYNLEPAFEELLKNKEILTFGNDNFLLFELSFFGEPPRINEVIWSMREAGYNPVLAHVERYTYWHNDYDKIEEMINRGVKLQMNIGSLTGSYGLEVKLFAEKLVNDEVIEFVGSDCHHMQHLQMIDHAKRLSSFQKLILQNQIMNNQL